MELLILGCGSATPILGRNPSAQLLMFPNAHYLIDCAEGTQMRLLEERIKPKFLKAIFISHLHGDHYLGLMGLLWSLDLGGRKRPISIVAHKGLFEIIDLLLGKATASFGFEVNRIVLEENGKGVVYRDSHIKVNSFPLKHGIACSGFRFTEVLSKRKFKAEAIEKFNLSNNQVKSAVRGEVVFDEGNNPIPEEDLVYPAARPKSYVYCTDTLPAHFAIDQIKKADLLYHETTYLHDRAELAEKRFHSTSLQAAEVAKQAKVGQLLIGHFSSRYYETDELVAESRNVFPDTMAAYDGLQVMVG